MDPIDPGNTFDTKAFFDDIKMAKKSSVDIIDLIKNDKSMDSETIEKLRKQRLVANKDIIQRFHKISGKTTVVAKRFFESIRDLEGISEQLEEVKLGTGYLRKKRSGEASKEPESPRAFKKRDTTTPLFEASLAEFDTLVAETQNTLSRLQTDPRNTDLIEKLLQQNKDLEKIFSSNPEEFFNFAKFDPEQLPSGSIQEKLVGSFVEKKETHRRLLDRINLVLPQYMHIEEEGKEASLAPSCQTSSSAPVNPHFETVVPQVGNAPVYIMAQNVMLPPQQGQAEQKKTETEDLLSARQRLDPVKAFIDEIERKYLEFSSKPVDPSIEQECFQTVLKIQDFLLENGDFAPTVELCVGITKETQKLFQERIKTLNTCISYFKQASRIDPIIFEYLGEINVALRVGKDCVSSRQRQEVDISRDRRELFFQREAEKILKKDILESLPEYVRFTVEKQKEELRTLSQQLQKVKRIKAPSAPSSSKGVEPMKDEEAHEDSLEISEEDKALLKIFEEGGALLQKKIESTPGDPGNYLRMHNYVEDIKKFLGQLSQEQQKVCGSLIDELKDRKAEFERRMSTAKGPVYARDPYPYSQQQSAKKKPEKLAERKTGVYGMGDLPKDPEKPPETKSGGDQSQKTLYSRATGTGVLIEGLQIGGVVAGNLLWNVGLISRIYAEELLLGGEAASKVAGAMTRIALGGPLMQLYLLKKEFDYLSEGKPLSEKFIMVAGAAAAAGLVTVFFPVGIVTFAAAATGMAVASRAAPSIVRHAPALKACALRKLGLRKRLEQRRDLKRAAVQKSL